MRIRESLVVLFCLSCSAGSPPAPAESPAPAAPAAQAPAVSPEPPAVRFLVPALFGDHMVLQRDRENPIWGWDRPSQTVTVAIDGKSQSVPAGQDGRWEAKLPAFAAGGPHTVTVSGSETKKFEDVVFGEVWLASGQSNMEFELARASDAATVIPAARRAELRMFTVKKRTAAEPVTDVEGSWQATTPETAPRFSAVGYFFGEKLQTTLGVPVGIIHSSWGGTPAEAWTSRTALAARP